MLRSAVTSLTDQFPVLEPLKTMSATRLVLLGTGILYTSFVIYRTTNMLYHGPSLLTHTTENFEKLNLIQKAGILTVGLPVYVAGEIIPRVCAYSLRQLAKGTRFIITSLWDGTWKLFEFLFNQLIRLTTELCRLLNRFFHDYVIPVVKALGRFLLRVMTDYVIPAVKEVGRFFRFLYDVLEHFVISFFTQLWECLTIVWDLAIELIKWPFRQLYRLLNYVYNLIATYIPRVLRWIWEGVKTVWNLSAEAFMFLWRPIQAWILRRWEQIKGLTWFLWTLMCQAWTTISRHAGNTRAWIANTAWQSYVYMTEAWTALGRNIYESYVWLCNLFSR